MADQLSAALFHWTFCHAQSDVYCDCEKISKSPTICPVGMLLEDEIMKLCSEFTPTVPRENNRRAYYASYRRKVRQSHTDDEHTQQRFHDKVRKQKARANEKPHQSKQRKAKDKTQTSKTRLCQKTKSQAVEDAMNNFKTGCKKKLVYICTSCHRLLWRKGVQSFNIKNYDNIDPEV